MLIYLLADVLRSEFPRLTRNSREIIINDHKWTYLISIDDVGDVYLRVPYLYDAGYDFFECRVCYIGDPDVAGLVRSAIDGVIFAGAKAACFAKGE